MFKTLYVKSIFGQISLKTKASSDLLESWHSRYFEGAEYKADMGILRFFIQNLNLEKLVSKLKPLDLLENLKDEYDSNISRYYM